MPSARASRRGAFLNWRLAVYGIQNADCSSVERSFPEFGALVHAASLLRRAYDGADRHL